MLATGLCHLRCGGLPAPFSGQELSEMLLSFPFQTELPVLPELSPSYTGPSHFSECLEHDETRTAMRIMSKEKGYVSDIKTSWSTHVHRHQILSSALHGLKKLLASIQVTQKNDSASAVIAWRRQLLSEDVLCIPVGFVCDVRAWTCASMSGSCMRPGLLLIRSSASSWVAHRDSTERCDRN